MVGSGVGTDIGVARSQALEWRRDRVFVGRAVGILVHRRAVLDAKRDVVAELTVIDQLMSWPMLLACVVIDR